MFLNTGIIMKIPSDIIFYFAESPAGNQGACILCPCHSTALCRWWSTTILQMLCYTIASTNARMRA